MILSGGSSAGIRDAACRIIGDMGELLLHGIAIKPGKPTIMGKAGNKPLMTYMLSIDEAEQQTGIDFFPALPDEIENAVEADYNFSDWTIK